MRQYLPTVSQLIDRLVIVTLKSIKIPENKEEYEKEAAQIMHDLDELCPVSGYLIRAIQINAISNEIIWANEAEARKSGDQSGENLLFTHSVNGVRTAAMNAISGEFSERKDLKVDCLASEPCKKRGMDFSGILGPNEKT